MLLKGRASATWRSIRADRSLWGLRTNNGFVMLVRIPYPYTEWETVHVFPYGEVPIDLDISPDGRWCRPRWPGSTRAAQGRRSCRFA